MIHIQIDNPELEKNIKKLYGENSQSIANDFIKFIQQQKIQQDVGVSIQQLEKGKSIPLDEVMSSIRAKYE